MRIAAAATLRSLPLAGLLAACGAEHHEVPSAPTTELASPEPRDLAWSDPVWLGPVINSPQRELGAALAANGRSLYFASDRNGGVGGFDIWVSRKAGPNCSWGPPSRLGPTINTPQDNGAPSISPGGRLLFFSSNGHGGFGDSDIFVSRRSDPNDDEGWETAVNLGPYVNTPDHESGPAFFRAGGAHLYFLRGSQESSKAYSVQLDSDGQPTGPAVVVAELNDPTTATGYATVRGDGREVIFWSLAGTRSGSVGLADLWAATRESPTHAWSRPQNLGTPVNHKGADLNPNLSPDGRTLVFSSAMTRGGLGRQDLWMSVRSPAGSEHAEDAGRSECPSS